MRISSFGIFLFGVLLWMKKDGISKICDLTKQKLD
jgi:hypothetical protein